MTWTATPRIVPAPATGTCPATQRGWDRPPGTPGSPPWPTRTRAWRSAMIVRPPGRTTRSRSRSRRRPARRPRPGPGAGPRDGHRGGPGQHHRCGHRRHAGHRPGMPPGLAPPPRPGRDDRHRETRPAERPGAMRHARPVSAPGRRVIGAGRQHLLTQPGGRDDGRLRHAAPGSRRAGPGEPAAPSRRRHSFRATACSQEPSWPGSLSPWSLAVAMIKVSATALAASAGACGSGSMDRQYAYSGAP